eukprot:2010459-Amphidinium_carterae.1
MAFDWRVNLSPSSSSIRPLSQSSSWLRAIIGGKVFRLCFRPFLSSRCRRGLMHLSCRALSPTSRRELTRLKQLLPKYGHGCAIARGLSL